MYFKKFMYTNNYKDIFLEPKSTKLWAIMSHSPLRVYYVLIPTASCTFYKVWAVYIYY